MGNAASATASAAPRSQLRVVGLGDPVTDILLNVDPAALLYLGAEPGSCVQARRRCPVSMNCPNIAHPLLLQLTRATDVDIIMQACNEHTVAPTEPVRVAGASL
jgi:hypothetical protein